MKLSFVVQLSIFIATAAFGQAADPGFYYVSADKINVRLAPDSGANQTNILHEKQKVEVFEVKDGWARISNFYDGAVEGKPGKVARWVYAKYLVEKHPEKEVTLSPLEEAIKSSDNYSKYKSTLIKASQQLINKGTCTLVDFNEMGGWMHSSKHKQKVIYFTYCGGMRKNNKIYLDVQSEKIFR